MLYGCEQGKTEDWIAQQCRLTGMPLPKAIENAPRIRMGLELYLWAFSELSTCRPWGFGGPLPIPWAAILEYAHVHRFTPRQARRLEVLTRKMDQAYMEWFGKTHGDK